MINSPGHKCKSNFFLLVGDEDEQDDTIFGELNTTKDSVVFGNSGVLEVSMHALSGHISPRTIRVKVQSTTIMSMFLLIVVIHLISFKKWFLINWDYLLLLPTHLECTILVMVII